MLGYIAKSSPWFLATGGRNLDPSKAIEFKKRRKSCRYLWVEFWGGSYRSRGYVNPGNNQWRHPLRFSLSKKRSNWTTSISLIALVQFMHRWLGYDGYKRGIYPGKFYITKFWYITVCRKGGACLDAETCNAKYSFGEERIIIIEGNG